MWVFDFLKNKLGSERQPTKIKPELVTVHPGKAVAEKIEVDVTTVEALRKTFISFDVETTGLRANSDRIAEIGSVMFVDGVPVKSFGTLVNPSISISAMASAVNHITDAMLAKAPTEQEVYPQLVEFLGEALKGKIIMCAHNARFDFDFLCNTLTRLGYDANIRYVDTMGLSRKYLKALENYKQCTVESYFGVTNAVAHRAESDAEACGKILCGILEYIDDALAEEKKQIEQLAPKQEELEVCAYIQSIIEKNGGDISWLRYRKNRSNYVDVTCLYTFLKFKFAKNGKYIIVRSDAANGIHLLTEPCTVSEGGTTFIRIYISNPFDLEPLSRYIFNVFSDCYKSMQVYIGMGNHAKSEAEQSIRLQKTISHDEMETLLLAARTREYVSTNADVQVESLISRENVAINAIHSRLPLCEILNLGNWENGFGAGYPFWEQGEMARINGLIEEAISLFDKARYNGYNAPALYESYAKGYHQIKDYDNEIVILEEGIERGSNLKNGILEARRNKALKLLFEQQEAERRDLIKALAKKQKTEQKIKEKEILASDSHHSRGRSIIQMTDDGTVIREFETISSAVNEKGINAKSIRDAANGVQKHAGGYCWKFKE